MGVFQNIQNWSRRRKYREGETISGFIACDVRRDVQVVSAARIDEGFITARIRTSNVLYISKGFVAMPEFEPAREIRIDELWKWTGKRWGGLPDGTSIVEHFDPKQVEQVVTALNNSKRRRISPGLFILGIFGTIAIVIVAVIYLLTRIFVGPL